MTTKHIEAHTPEPWIFEAPDADHEGIIIGRRGGAVVDGDFTEANARRIVAAVNACESIPTEDLESIAGRIALKSVMQMHANYVRNKEKVYALEQQRDKLLAALEEAEKYMVEDWHLIDSDRGPFSTTVDEEPVIAMVRAVIAEAKGESK